MNPMREIVIAAKDDVFDGLFKAGTRLAVLEGEGAEAEYVAKGERLREQIVAVGDELFEPVFSKKHLNLDLDWYPTHTCYIDASIDGFSQAYFDGLRGLLVGEFADWRIQVVVYGDIRNGRTMVGSIAICAETLLIDRALYAVMTWRGMDFRCESKPVWRKAERG